MFYVEQIYADPDSGIHTLHYLVEHRHEGIELSERTSRGGGPLVPEIVVVGGRAGAPPVSKRIRAVLVVVVGTRTTVGMRLKRPQQAEPGVDEEDAQLPRGSRG